MRSVPLGLPWEFSRLPPPDCPSAGGCASHLRTIGSWSRHYSSLPLHFSSVKWRQEADVVLCPVVRRSGVSSRGALEGWRERRKKQGPAGGREYPLGWGEEEDFGEKDGKDSCSWCLSTEREPYISDSPRNANEGFCQGVGRGRCASWGQQRRSAGPGGRGGALLPPEARAEAGSCPTSLSCLSSGSPVGWEPQ